MDKEPTKKTPAKDGVPIKGMAGGLMFVSTDGSPFKSEQDALNFIDNRDDVDPLKCRIVDVEGGKAVLHLGELKDVPNAQKLTLRDEDGNLTYHWVRFHAKSTASDTDDVSLSVNGEVLSIMRETDVVIPASFLENASHAVRTLFRQVPNLPRKITGRVLTYPFTYLRAGTKEEFDRQKREGTLATRMNVQRYGFDYMPDDSVDRGGIFE